ncbi:hypothetical protein DCAR_0206441 [Daucus carota subsp. sativus]|uniref:RING-type E3 ubiquitin transferase n=1 Tax=Daucus carota subsp. sativus TaxID=79200 RepID=A0AAF0WFK0_DAUCS|nr:PREDICTED: E3 ubiquitin-protein ligase HEL2-like isoform X3 [Daucus carota subsp. sativus]WOG87218.1 hypothetical protein DCAR_0206441 [Daucus carota subsp. sativus]
MDDSCAVCAETLEWVAYGPCGHKDVCSTCVVRLRFICDDRRCCICKSQSDVVFITRALGDYTKMISDFSVLPAEVKEGRVGQYWYHEDTQGFFDDLDHYRMIKAMCKLSCAACDKMGEPQGDGSRRSRKFRNIGQLKGHLFHQHRLVMCSLCLEGRKVFICEQKLYTRAQLNQHINSGDSEVDGTESERGGFMGHPMCEFCRTPFYGENELYTHMSTEHYTCHICQRQHPGQYEYYKNYDDLESHFRHRHFLCENESCLAKKFVVFQTEAEMKRHNTMEHGGHMSRSQRSAALQIPVSFQYRRSNEQDNRRGRGRGRGLVFQHDRSDAELSMAIEASLDTANTDIFPAASSGSAQVTNIGDASDSIIQSFDSLATTDSEPPTRYLQALSQRSRITLQESSFPPLVTAPESNQQKTNHDPEGLPKNSMVDHLRRQKNKNARTPSSSQAWPAAVGNNKSTGALTSTQEWPAAVGNNKSTGALTSTQEWPAPVSNKQIDTFSSSQAWPAAGRGPLTSASSKQYAKASANVMPGSSSDSVGSKPAKNNGPATSSYLSLAQGQPSLLNEPSSSSSSSSRGGSGSSRIIHSSSAPNLVEAGSSESDFPPVSAMKKQPLNLQAVLNVEDVQTANKSLVERIHAGLSFDQDKYIAFKEISGEFRQGLMDASTYLMHVHQFGLTHLVLELAKLCPDAEKQRDLVDTFYANFSTNNNIRENGGMSLKQSNGDKKGKGKSIGASSSSSKDKLADEVISTVRKLQSNYKAPVEDEVEILSKDGYRAARGKSNVIINEPQTVARTSDRSMLKVENSSHSVDDRYNLNSGTADGKNKQKKKTSKFHRVRLGDGSMASLLDSKSSDTDPEPESESGKAAFNGNKNLEGLPVRGVWRNGGGNKLLAKTSKDARR